MDAYLVTLSFRPVQSLIGAARRTRDLWCGSWLLSEAARAAARVLHLHQPGCLVFPCPDDPDAELLPQDHPGDGVRIANVLRAAVSLPDVQAARALGEQAKAAVIGRLVELGQDARHGLGAPLREAVWQAQITDLLESFAAWARVPADAWGYASASTRIGGALAARKATRDFRPCGASNTAGLPKCSLDGALETVLPDWDEGHRARRKLRLSAGDQLDALAVIKRLAGDAEQFTAYSRIAADPWIASLTPEQQQRLRAAYEPLVRLELASRVSGNRGIYAALPYDAQLLYGFRRENALSQARDAEEGHVLQSLDTLLADLANETDADEHPIGTPVPYAGILEADGDWMSVLLSRSDSAACSRDISRTLHGFASGVREILRVHRGHAIYAGGDDVLALVPLADAVAVRASRAEPQRFEADCDADLPAGLLPVILTEDASGKPGKGPLWWAWTDLLAFRQGQDVIHSRLTEAGWSPPPGDRRTHVAIDPGAQAADPGRLFQTEGLDLSAPMAAPHADLRLLMRCGESLQAGLVHLGGERRLAALNPEPAEVWPTPPPGWLDRIVRAGGLSLTLLTPAIFTGGFRPGRLDNRLEGAPPDMRALRLRLLAAAVDRWQPQSGWDLPRHQPRPTRKLAPAGATYWFRLLGAPGADELVALWLSSVSDHPQDRRDGFGLALPAAWTPCI